MKILNFKTIVPSLKKDIPLPSSKSESNRALIIQALSQEKIILENLSIAEDTVIMQKALQSTSHLLDIGAAGTAMRFLTAYCAIKADKSYVLYGTERMHERPIGALVQALQSLGAQIEYKEKIGFPPLQINPAFLNAQYVSIRGDISSQYISALMLIAPLLSNGLEIRLTSALTSALYCQMTKEIMEHFGAKVHMQYDKIIIAPQNYKGGFFAIEGDWSAASYWFMIVALYPESCSLFLPNLKIKSLQPDSICTQLFEHFGVKSTFIKEGLILEKIPNFKLPESFEYDFSNCPDIAQTIACTCAALGINALLTGLKTLKIKETDRLIALCQELGKFGIDCIHTHETLYVKKGILKQPTQAIATYKDHRMAMAFAPMVLKTGYLEIEDESVVQKSYPNFWEALALVL